MAMMVKENRRSDHSDDLTKFGKSIAMHEIYDVHRCDCAAALFLMKALESWGARKRECCLGRGIATMKR